MSKAVPGVRVVAQSGRWATTPNLAGWSVVGQKQPSAIVSLHGSFVPLGEV